MKYIGLFYICSSTLQRIMNIQSTFHYNQAMLTKLNTFIVFYDFRVFYKSEFYVGLYLYYCDRYCDLHIKFKEIDQINVTAWNLIFANFVNFYEV